MNTDDHEFSTSVRKPGHGNMRPIADSPRSGNLFRGGIIGIGIINHSILNEFISGNIHGQHPCVAGVSAPSPFGDEFIVWIQLWHHPINLLFSNPSGGSCRPNQIPPTPRLHASQDDRSCSSAAPNPWSERRIVRPTEVKTPGSALLISRKHQSKLDRRNKR